MEPVRLAEVLRAVKGTLFSGNLEKGVITGVSIDSRNVKPGDLFFAFPGKRVDGHSFVGAALARGAQGAVVSKPVEVKSDCTLIFVSDTFTALRDLAQYYRTLFQLPVVAVTGSTGKTTTKDLVAGVLSVRYRVLKTEGNQNNEIGLPLTVLSLEKWHEALVLEMAMRGRGEIATLCQISKPNIGAITNIGKTHLERLGSQEEIAEAKGELLHFLLPDGCAVLNGCDPWQLCLAGRMQGNVIFYGEGEKFPVSAFDIKSRGLEGVDFFLRTPKGKTECFLPLPGKHNVFNALAAAAVGHLFGLMPLEIAQGLASASITGMRMRVREGICGSRIIDDTYNASPASMEAALQILASVPEKKRSVAVLGDMYELGWYTIPGHREVGRAAAELKIDRLFTIGSLAREIAEGAREKGMDRGKIEVFSDKKEVVSFLRAFLKEGDLVLVKGSRALKMEEIVAALLPGGYT